MTHNVNAPQHQGFESWARAVNATLAGAGLPGDTVDAMLAAYRPLAHDLHTDKVPPDRAARLLWDETFYGVLENEGIPRSDAQALHAQHDRLIDEIYRMGATPAIAAKVLQPAPRKRNNALEAAGPYVERLMRALFVDISQEEIDMVIDRLTAVHPQSEAAQDRFDDQMLGVGAIFEGTAVAGRYRREPVGAVRKLLIAALDADFELRRRAGSLRLEGDGGAAFQPVPGPQATGANRVVEDWNQEAVDVLLALDDNNWLDYSATATDDLTAATDRARRVVAHFRPIVEARKRGMS